LVYVGEKMKEFPVSSPHYGKWTQVAWALIAPREETTSPTALAQILKQMYLKLGQPEAVIVPCVYASGSVRVGNLTFTKEEIGTVEITKGHVGAIVSLNERSEDASLLPPRDALRWNETRSFNFEGANKSIATLRVEESKKESRTMYRCTVVSLFPTKATAQAALETISLPRDYIIIDPPIHIRGNKTSPVGRRV
jgi:hypothetical protein